MELISRLLTQLGDQNVALTAKAVQALAIAARNAEIRDRTCGSDDLLFGVVRADSVVTNTIADLLNSSNKDAVMTEVSELQATRPPAPKGPQLFVGTDAMDEFVQPTWVCSRGWIQGYRRTDGQFSPPSISDMPKVYGNAVSYAKKKNTETLDSFDMFRAIAQISEYTTWDSWAKKVAARIPVLSRGARILTAVGLDLEGIQQKIDALLGVDGAADEQCFLLQIDGDGRFHLQPFDLLDYYRYKDHRNTTDTGLTFIRSNLVTLNYNTFFARQEIEELEWLINRRDVSERELQKFFETHPKFLLGTEYHRLHSQVILTRDDSNLIPDFFVERVGSQFCDIVDLKTPNAKLVVGKRNRRTFSAALVSALGQLREYRNYFDDARNRRLFTERYGLDAFRPQMSVVIGRSSEFSSELERVQLQDEFRNLKVVTYDDIVARAKNRMLLLK